MNYITIIIFGILVFPLLAAVFTFPYMLFQYYRYGEISKYRNLIVYSFILYMLIAYFMVILPLPDPDSTVGSVLLDHLNLIPFRQIWLYWHGKSLSPAALSEYLKSFSLWQLLFNILLTMPFGIYLRYYFRQSFGRTVLFSFFLSLFYETTQLSALYGIYPGPYRLADVEDLICNTLGGLLGYQIAYVFMLILPRREAIDAFCRKAGRQISGLRRYHAALFDLIFDGIICLFMYGAVLILFPAFTYAADAVLIHSFSFFCVFSFVQVISTGGLTLGHAICRMILKTEEGSVLPAGQAFRRYGILWLLTELPLILIEIVDAVHQMDALMFLGLVLLSRFYFVMYFFNEVFARGARPMPHDRMSGTLYMATELPEE